MQLRPYYSMGVFKVKIIGKVVNDFTQKRMIGVVVTDCISLQQMSIQETDLYTHNGGIDNFLEFTDNSVKLKDFDNNNIPMYLPSGAAYRANPIVILYKRYNDYCVVLPTGDIRYVDTSYLLSTYKNGMKLANARVVNNRIVSGIGKQRIKFEVYMNLKDCTDSMLFDNGERIAIYGTDDNYVALDVYGDVRVEYGEDIYCRASEFPPKLIRLFKEGKANSEHGVYVGYNNWFDYVHVLNGCIMSDDVVCESDISKMTKAELKEEMKEMYEYFNQENRG